MASHSEPAVPAAVAIDPAKPHSARIYDYFLGGKDNFAADRAVAEQAIAAWPPRTAPTSTRRPSRPTA